MSNPEKTQDKPEPTKKTVSAWTGTLAKALPNLPNFVTSEIETQLVARGLNNPSAIENSNICLHSIQAAIHEAYVASAQMVLDGAKSIQDMRSQGKTLSDIVAVLRESAGGDAYSILEKCLVKEGN